VDHSALISSVACTPRFSGIAHAPSGIVESGFYTYAIEDFQLRLI